MKQGSEQPYEPAIEKLDDKALHKYAREIRALEYDPLNTDQDQWQIGWGQEVDHMFEEYLAPGAHGDLFVLKDANGKIVAFFGLTESDDSTEATIESIRLKHKDGQEEVLIQLFGYLKKEGYHKSFVQPAKASRELEKISRLSGLSDFLVVEKAEASSQEKLAA